VRAWVYAALALGPFANTATAAEKQNVLVLAGRDSQQPAYELFMGGFRAGLNARAANRLELFTEFLDSTRFPQIEHAMRMREFLQEKYAATRIDLVISTSPVTLDFVLQHRNTLFPNVPVVFALVSEYELPAKRLPDDVIGILDRFDLAKTLEMAQRLQPRASQVVVVSGAGTFDKTFEDIARRELQVNDRGLEFSYLSGLPLGRLLEEVAHLPRDTIILLLSFSRDGTGELFRPPDVAPKVAAVSTAPMYSVFGVYAGRGVVGGYMNSLEAVGERAAAVALRILAGERPEQVRAALGPEGSYVADARQMQRWNLDESQLPAGSVVRFREPSIWIAYRWYIAAAAAAIVLQSLLIAALILQRRARRRAEEETQRRRAELAQASRLALAGELTATIAHEINQPLGAILANAGAAEALLRRGVASGDEMRAIIGDIKQADIRASEVIRRVRALVTTRQVAREVVDVNAMVRDVLAFLQGEAERRDVVVDAAYASELAPVLADRVQLQQAIVNLCVNSLDAMTGTALEKRRLSLRTRTGARGSIEIAVGDTGPGIPPDQLPRLFDSFFTTKADGMGLGLSISRSIVEQHGGELLAENRDRGALFRIVLPAYREGEPASDEASSDEAAPSPPARTISKASP